MLYTDLLKRWSIDFAVERPDLVIAGSPERTDQRMVIEDRQGALFIVEAIPQRLAARKRHIAGILELISTRGLPEIAPYRRNITGDFLGEHGGKIWQVVSYVPGVQLDRPGYVFDHWRGEAAADFLLRLRAAAPLMDEPAFSLPSYIDHLIDAIRTNRPDVLPKAREMHLFVKEHLYPVYDRLPTAFAHGDFHAINIIWGNRGIAAVIDWEFCGIKPELYDAANMISCLGIEDPECLWSGAAVSFVEKLRASGKYAAVSFKYLRDLMIAFRFAWLSEWLRKNDDEMIRMEFDYFDVLSSLAPVKGD